MGLLIHEILSLLSSSCDIQLALLHLRANDGVRHMSSYNPSVWLSRIASVSATVSTCLKFYS